MERKNVFKRVQCYLLVFALLITMIPGMVFATSAGAGLEGQEILPESETTDNLRLLRERQEETFGRFIIKYKEAESLKEQVKKLESIQIEATVYIEDSVMEETPALAKGDFFRLESFLLGKRIGTEVFATTKNNPADDVDPAGCNSA